MPTRGDRASIDWIVDRYHVGMSDAEVTEDMRARIARSSMVGPAQYGDAIVAYALRAHHANQSLYRRVTSGRLG
jgi:hypothetical protein